MTDAKATERILSGRLPLEVLRFGAPVALGMGLQVTFNLVDAYIVSRLTPEVAGPALGALGICDQLSAMGTIVSYGITTASTAMIARAAGRGDREAVRRIVWQSLIAVGGLSIAFGLVAVLFAGPLVAGAVGAKGAVAELGAAYLRVNSGLAFTGFFLLQLTSIQRALGSAKTPMVLLLGSNLVNVFLAVLLVYGSGPAPPVFAWGPPIARLLHIPRLELVGAAWATAAARLISLVPVVIVLARRFDVLPRVGSRGPDWTALRNIWRIGWPSSAQFVVRIFALLITLSVVARAFTTPEDQSASTALGVALRLETLALFVSVGWGSAAQTFVGQNLGAGNRDRALASVRWAATYNGIFMAGLAVLYLLASPAVIGFFDDHPRVIDVAVEYLRIVGLSYVGLGTGVVLGSAISGAGATRTTLVADLAVVLLVQLPACALAVLTPGASLFRLWLAVAGAYVITGAVFAFVFYRVPWTRAMTKLEFAGRSAAERESGAPPAPVIPPPV
jgi:putative MATE family efflux protein